MPFPGNRPRHGILHIFGRAPKSAKIGHFRAVAQKPRFSAILGGFRGEVQKGVLGGLQRGGPGGGYTGGCQGGHQGGQDIGGGHSQPLTPLTTTLVINVDNINNNIVDNVDNINSINNNIVDNVDNINALTHVINDNVATCHATSESVYTLRVTTLTTINNFKSSKARSVARSRGSLKDGSRVLVDVEGVWQLWGERRHPPS